MRDPALRLRGEGAGLRCAGRGVVCRAGEGADRHEHLENDDDDDVREVPPPEFDERTPENRRHFQRRQADSILEYRSEFERAWGGSRTPHVVLSRSVWPGATTDAALVEATEATREWNAFSRTVGRLQDGLTPAEEFLSDKVAWGTVADLVDDLVADPSFGLSDELVLGLHPGRYTVPLAVEKARALIDEAYPLLDAEWQRARATLSERVAEHDAQRESVTA